MPIQTINIRMMEDESDDDGEDLIVDVEYTGGEIHQGLVIRELAACVADIVKKHIKGGKITDVTVCT